jgi:hypothetical protein
MCGVEIGAVNRAQASARALAPAAVVDVAQPQRQDRLEQHCAVPLGFRAKPAYIPSVQIGPDRALE